MTRSSVVKWIVGSVAFFGPTLVAIAGTVLHWDVRATFWGSLVLAAIIPPSLVLTSPLRWRIAFALGLWALLAIQFCLILLILLAGFRE